MAQKVYSYGVVEVVVAAGEKIAVSATSTPAKVYQKVGFPNFPDAWEILDERVLDEEYVSAAFSSATTVKIEAGANGALYATGASPQISEPVSDLVGTENPFNITGLAAAQGGAVTVTGGASSTAANAGGAINVVGGAPGATGVGGAIAMASGAGGSTSGASGAVSIASGTTTAGSASATGAVELKSGAGAASSGTASGGATGTVTISSGAGGANTGGGSGGHAGAAGNISVAGGVGGSTNSAGTHNGGAGADIAISAGAGGNATAGNGNGGAGGTVLITAGTGGTSVGGTAGVDGCVILRGTLGVKQGNPAAKTTSATLTAAEVITGIITVNQGGGANSALQLPAGSTMDTAFPDFSSGDAFDFSVVNISTNAAETASITTNTGLTLVGNMLLAANTAVTANSQGRFRGIKIGAGTWTFCRIA